MKVQKDEKEKLKDTNVARKGKPHLEKFKKIPLARKNLSKENADELISAGSANETKDKDLASKGKYDEPENFQLVKRQNVSGVDLGLEDLG